MKRIKSILLLMLIALVPNFVNAASGNISVSASNTVMVGNTVTVTVKLSSSTGIGSWEMDLNYDKSFLQLTKSGAESGGTRMANSVTSGIKSKSYTFTFKTLKTGSTKVSVGSYLAYDFNTMSQISLSSGSATINIKTKEQIEATYSSNAYLKSLTVDKGSLSPEFNKDKFEYTVEVENDVETINIGATKEDGNAQVSGTGEQELTEGNNKFEIICTAQKGNSNKYIVNVYRKELNPITINVSGKELSIIRKSSEYDIFSSFVPITIDYEEETIPALKNEASDLTIIGLKDSDGNKLYYIYEDGNIKDRYQELTNGTYTIYPLQLKENEMFKKLTKVKNETLGVETYKLNEKSIYVIMYAKDVLTGNSDYYLFNTSDSTFIKFDSEMLVTNTNVNNYIYVILTLIVIIIILIFIVIFKGKKSNKNISTNIENKVETIDAKIEVISYEDDKESIDEKESVSKQSKKEAIKETKRLEKEAKKKEKEERKKKDEFDF